MMATTSEKKTTIKTKGKTTNTKGRGVTADLARDFSALLWRDVDPDQTPGVISVLDVEDSGYELAAVARAIDTAKALGLGVRLVARDGGYLFAVTRRHVYEIDYETGRPTRADDEVSQIVRGSLAGE